MGKVVFLTGVSRHLGGAVARALAADPEVDRVIGADLFPPPHDIGGAEFVRADIRNPVVGKILTRAEVDTVVHMNMLSTPVAAGGRSSQKEINVIGTMQLLAACQKADSVRHMVVKSSASVYGSSPHDPAVFTEDMNPQVAPRTGFGKDSMEVEGYVRGFGRRRPDVDVAVLRFANIVGPGMRTSLTDYFSLPVVPTPLGYDGRLQFVHEDDAVRALVLATQREGLGTVNVAGDGTLTVRQAVRLAHRAPLPLPRVAGSAVGQLVRRAGLADFSGEQQQFLSFGRSLDTRRMREVLGLEPRFTTREAFVDLVDAGRRGA
ncbi:MAG TPA: NAD-dependent epimerase/dehydratase family protein [Segeticoccus sp.]|uniref:NAD-dependent epimerase/dehydratase family protein n=1 Tax=Segeticoccus sp. TaxID=2706531 RepID=UPI002D7E5609|nr:NAD-dependent epimerase/dehydratase family protein [Segeticoccus sp.]HET8599177.1 NAD-dependent epimerase/dehydratase family protein [Segeticoccus sp.]